MVFNKFRVETESGADPELCLDSDLLGKMQKSVKLEQKVAQLFESLREPVYHYLMAVFGNAAEAEDITQEMFLQLYRSLDGGIVIENVRPWIFRVAHNLAINARKHNQFFKPLDDRTWEDIALLLPDNALNPEQNLLQQEKYHY
jgi:RNA polymerase sigma-70 factor (ECF subfamily)